ncbi:MAG: tRNA epoxyqueuosine(34) reductase QueG [Verrucomicrobia bacterium]|nr:tRNA epoxyqueuosine(34) reductase QueG [Verrucomicrobiota bacterium]
MTNVKQEELRRRLEALGFDDVRFGSVGTGAGPSPASRQALRDWLDAGRQADMHWMDRTAEKRLSPELVLPGARSVVMLGVNYWSDALQAGTAVSSTRVPAARGGGAALPTESPVAPIWARYALHEDYHDTIKPALAAAGRVLEEIHGVGPQDYRYYVDTGPILERDAAARAGVGFIGKNAMLISRRHGNWLLLAAILTRIEFTPDEPVRKNPGDRPVGLLCGKCTRCLDACPTDAFPQPGVVDARRCISYQTIENRGVIPRELRAGIGNRIYGCDVCLEVCPWNRFAREGRRMLLSARHDLVELALPDILALTPERFAAVFRRTPIKRLKLAGLLRNACVVAGNSGDRSLLPQLGRLAAAHDAPLVRAHAVWAVFRLGGGARLGEARARERDAIVLAEYAAGVA